MRSFLFEASGLFWFFGIDFSDLVLITNYLFADSISGPVQCPVVVVGRTVRYLLEHSDTLRHSDSELLLTCCTGAQVTEAASAFLGSSAPEISSAAGAASAAEIPSADIAVTVASESSELPSAVGGLAASSSAAERFSSSAVDVASASAASPGSTGDARTAGATASTKSLEPPAKKLRARQATVDAGAQLQDQGRERMQQPAARQALPQPLPRQRDVSDVPRVPSSIFSEFFGCICRRGSR